MTVAEHEKMDVVQVVTEDGVVVLSQRMPWVRSVAVGAWMTVGSRDETPEQ